MALINCPECGREISSSASQCPHCGFDIQNRKKVTILGYTESFANTPVITVIKDGAIIGEVRQNEKVEFDIDDVCTLQFKYSFRSRECLAKPGDWILLSFNRTTGSLTAIRTDKDRYLDTINQVKSKDGKRWIWTVIIMAMLFLLSLYLRL
jgi:primosomal protein N'